MTPQTILDFWFSDTTKPYWFAKSETFDRQLSERFGETLKQAAAGELYTWRTSLKGRLAEIIVLDQFSRNIYRDTPQAFAQDAMALALAQEAVSQAGFSQMPAHERHFILMPYMHSESALIHEHSLPLFRALNNKNTLDFELRHQAIIQRFGRYPHRNAILGRTSTDEELAFLQEEGSSF